MTTSWRHKGLKLFYETVTTSGIQPHHAENLKCLLFHLAASVRPEDMDTPGNNFHPLIEKLKKFYSVKVNKNWRVIFQFEGEDNILVDYVDYC